MKDTFKGHAKELIAFAFIQEDYQKNGDITQGLIPLFAPIIHDMAGRVFDAWEFAKAVQEKYDIAMRPIVAESLIPKLVEGGLLSKEEKSKYIAVYRCVAGPAERRSSKDEQLDTVLTGFYEFAKEALAKQNHTTEITILTNGFIERLKNMDFSYVLNGVGHYYQGQAGDATNNDTARERTSNELAHALDILTAEYMTMLTEKDPQQFDLLVEIAAGAMIADLVLTLQQPAANTNQQELTTALDGPLIMDMLDLNTQESLRFAQDLMDLLKKAKVTIITFKHVVDEIKGSIYAPLEAYINGQDAYGPLAARLRQNPAHAPYARAVFDGLNEFIENLGISIVNAADYDGEEYHRFCSKEVEDTVRNCLGPLHEAVDRRIRDAASIACVMRMRKGHISTAAITESKFIFVTRNVQVANRSTDCLLAKKAMGYDDVPPCILDRQIAGVLWLCLGGSVNKLTREKLLANCMDALYPRPNLVATVRGFLEKLDSEKARIFEALMRDKRAQRCLLHKTFGYTHTVTQDNVAELLEEIRRSTAEEVKQEAQQNEKQLGEKYEQLYKKQASDLNSARDEAERLQREKDDITARRDQVDLAALERACKTARKVERCLKTGILMGYLTVVTGVAYISDKAGVGWWIYPLCGLVALAGFWFVPEKLFRSTLDQAWQKIFMKEVSDSKVEEWDKRFSLDRDACKAMKLER